VSLTCPLGSSAYACSVALLQASLAARVTWLATTDVTAEAASHSRRLRRMPARLVGTAGRVSPAARAAAGR
jgi:hypothetical protein